jgi:diguanylate cyclase
LRFEVVMKLHPVVSAPSGGGSSNVDSASSPTTGGERGDVALADWDTLFVAVATKLRQAVGTGLLSSVPLRSMSVDVKGQVLQCLSALDQLRTTMLHQIERTSALEGELRSALTSAQSDLADAHANERTARHEAAHDSLTSLPNREHFRARLATLLAQAAERGHALALLYIDLDGFKAINDTHGHATGDQLLRIIAARLAGAVRAEDMVSRLGGDEFACLLWDAPPGRPAVSRLATTLIDVVSAPFQIGTLALSVRPSIGVALWPDDGPTAEILLDHADSAMYHAKRTQTGHAYFRSDAGASLL